MGKGQNDYSTLLTFGNTGNLAVTYLGSYKLYWNVISMEGKSATVQIRVENSSTGASAFRPPLLGYTKFWRQNVSPWVNSQFSSGPMSKTSQTFIWNESINIK